MLLAALLGFSTVAFGADTGLETGSTADTGTPPEETGDPPDTDPPEETGDTAAPVDPGLDDDNDNDGVTPRDGDCNDAEPKSKPGLPESCEDRLDNDCDGLFDEECDDSVRIASLGGGGGCTGGTGVAGTQGALFLPFGALLLLGRWRRR